MMPLHQFSLVSLSTCLYVLVTDLKQSVICWCLRGNVEIQILLLLQPNHFLQRFREANVPIAIVVASPKRWQPSVQNWVKFNFDASILLASCLIEIGVVIRNVKGKFFVAMFKTSIFKRTQAQLKPCQLFMQLSLLETIIFLM